MVSRFKTIQETFDENDMLRGNVNRMFVSDDKGEIQTMYNAARTQLQQIYLYFLYARNVTVK